MNAIASPMYLIVPGLRDHMPDHWQTILENRLPNASAVPRRSRDKLSCAAWVADLDRSLADIDGPVVLVAHSGGVMIVVHWAQHHKRPIRGALLAAPADLESPLPEGYPRSGRRYKMEGGCRSRARRCRFRASSRRVPTIRSENSPASPASPPHGAVVSSTWATSVISIPRPVSANGRRRKRSSASCDSRGLVRQRQLQR